MFHGSIVALITPFKADGKIDYDAVSRLIDFHINNGTDGIVVCGSTGEAATLTEEESLELIRFVRREVNGRMPVIAGTGTNCTKKTIDKTKKAVETGIDACLIVVPYYNKPTQEGLFLHYKTITDSVPVPIILYNIPGRTGVDLLPETVLRLADISNIVALKESSASTELLLERTSFYAKNLKGRLDILSGDDKPTLQTIQLGAKGVISVVANVAPKQMHLLCEYALKNDWQQAKNLDNQLAPLYDALFLEVNPIPVKWALSRMNYCQPDLRLPLTTLTPASQLKLETAFQQAQII